MLLKLGKKWQHSEPQIMDDMAPSHRAKSTRDWQRALGIKLFAEWPGNSPDLNLIENFLSQIKNLQKKRAGHIKQVNQKSCL